MTGGRFAIETFLQFALSIATGSAVGLVGFGLYFERIRRVEIRTRNRLVEALLVEIELSFSEGEKILSDDSLNYLVELIENGKKPRIVIDDRHFIFESHQSELSLLKKETLSAVISYYEMDKIVSLALKSFEEEEFLAYPLDRKKRQISALKDLVEKYRHAGKAALDNLNSSRRSR